MNAQVATNDKTIFAGLTVFNAPGPSTSKIEDDNSGSDVEGKVKTRLLSMWNNVKFGKFSFCLKMLLN